MSELEKAKQEVEQVCFAYGKAGDTGDIKDWKKYYDLENKLIDKVKIANQPQLTIPKSVVRSVEKHRTDGYGHEDFEELVWDWAYELIYKYNEPFEKQFESLNDEEYHKAWSEIELPNEISNSSNERFNIIRAYLNPLTRDLVKVVEG